MKKLISLILVACMILSVIGCTKTPDEKTCSVNYYDSDMTLIETVEDVTISKIADKKLDDKVIDGKTYYFYGWDIDTAIDDVSIDAKALYYNELTRSETKMTYSDLSGKALSMDQRNHILVVFVSFTDGVALDKTAFEDTFTGNYSSDERLRSVSSYYKYTGYGNEPFDFNFVYYDSGMTSYEGYHYVNDEDKYGNFKGNDFFFDIFRKLKADGTIDTTKLDANSDGYVDSTIWVFGDSQTDGCYLYGAAQGFTSTDEFSPDKNDPVMGNYIKLEYESLNTELERGSFGHESTRILIHEMGHLFGLVDYYDFEEYEGQILDTLGAFDMQSFDVGDWNSFSKFSTGILEPYIITDGIDTVTLRLRASSEYNDAILIPTSKGWNGTAFDEYILVDVMAPDGGYGFDWDIIVGEAENRVGEYFDEVKNIEGGVRILHVDARLTGYSNGKYHQIDDPLNMSKYSWIDHRFTNSNGVDPVFSEDSRFYHLVEFIPSDLSSKFRISTPTSYSAFSFLSTNDLFGEGDSFDLLEDRDCFTNGEKMNNGSDFNYQITVDYYNSDTHEAIVTITRVK